MAANGKAVATKYLKFKFHISENQNRVIGAVDWFAYDTN